MSRSGQIITQPEGQVLLENVRWCESFLCKFMGLMFRKALEPGEGLLMVEPRLSRSSTAIHMLFMRFPIAAIWLDDHMQVVSKVLARPWRLAYIPEKPARFTLETSPEYLDQIEIGDKLAFKAADG